MVSKRYGPESVYEEALRQVTPESIALALVALTAGDIRSILLDTAELGDALGCSPQTARAWAKQHGVHKTRIGHRVYCSKLHVITALHGGNIKALHPAMAAVGLPAWVAKVGD